MTEATGDRGTGGGAIGTSWTVGLVNVHYLATYVPRRGARRPRVGRGAPAVREDGPISSQVPLRERGDRAPTARSGRAASPGIDSCSLGDTNGDGKPDIAVHKPAMEEVWILSGADYEVLVTVRTSPLLMHNVGK